MFFDFANLASIYLSNIAKTVNSSVALLEADTHQNTARQNVLRLLTKLNQTSKGN